jgi:Tfp pilus assembly protein PilF
VTPPAPAAEAPKAAPAEAADASPSPEPEKRHPKGGKAEAARLQKAGYRALERGDVPGAIASFRKSIALNPVAALSYRGLGAAYQAKGDGHEAAKAYRRYLALSPRAQDVAEVRSLIQQLQ